LVDLEEGEARASGQGVESAIRKETEPTSHVTFQGAFSCWHSQVETAHREKFQPELDILMRRRRESSRRDALKMRKWQVFVEKHCETLGSQPTIQSRSARVGHCSQRKQQCQLETHLKERTVHRNVQLHSLFVAVLPPALPPGIVRVFPHTTWRALDYPNLSLITNNSPYRPGPPITAVA
jgi:hypothetical protein